MPAVTVSALNTALGAFNRANKDLLFSNMLLDWNVSDLFTVMEGIKDEAPMPNLTVSDLLQPGNNLTFNPLNNTLSFDANVLKVRNWKVDLLIDPNALEKTWLGDRGGSGTGINNKKMPFEQYVMQQIVAKVKENMRLKAIWKGVYNASSATPGAIMDGLLGIQDAAVTATKLTPIVTGAITSTNVIDKLLLVYDGLSEAVKGSPTQMPVNSQIFDWYCRKFAPVLNSSIIVADAKGAMGTPQFNEVPLAGTNCTLKREPGLGTSQRVEVTTKSNRIFGCDTLAEGNSITTQEFERTIKLMIDGKAGVGYALLNNEIMRINDQA